MSIVFTGSMVPTYVPGDMVVIIPWMKPGVGDIAVFETPMAPNLDEQFLIAHRIIGQDDRGFITKGDAGENPDWWRIEPGQVKGQVVWWFPSRAFYYGASILIGLGVTLLLWPRSESLLEDLPAPEGARLALAPPPLDALDPPQGPALKPPHTHMNSPAPSLR